MTAAGWIALAIAVAGAFCYAAGSILQAVGAKRSKNTVRTLGHPLYLIGVVFDLLAWAGSMVALRELAVYLVESVLASSLAVTVVLARLILKSRVRRRDVVAIVISVGALTVLAMSAGEQESVPHTTSLRIGFCVGAVVMVALGWGAAKVAPPGVVAGLAGLTLGAAALAGRALTVPEGVSGGAVALAIVTEPMTWALLVFAVGGMLMYTHALQHGQVGPVTAVLWIGEVIAPSAVALIVLGDTVRPGWELRAGLAGLVVVGAAAVLATAPATSATAHPVESTEPAQPEPVQPEPVQPEPAPQPALPQRVSAAHSPVALPAAPRLVAPRPAVPMPAAHPAVALPMAGYPAGALPSAPGPGEALPVGAFPMHALPAGALRPKSRPVRGLRPGIRRAHVVWPAVPGDRRIPVRPFEDFVAGLAGLDDAPFDDPGLPLTEPDPGLFAGSDPGLFAGSDPWLFAGSDPWPYAESDPRSFTGSGQKSFAEPDPPSFAGSEPVPFVDGGARPGGRRSDMVWPVPPASRDVAVPSAEMNGSRQFADPGVDGGDASATRAEKIIWWGPAPIWIPPHRPDEERPAARELPAERPRPAVEAPHPVPELTWHPPHRDRWMWADPPSDADPVEIDPDETALPVQATRPWQDMFRDETRQLG